MWKIIQQILPALLVILLLSQYVVPVLFNTRTWWLFRKNKKDVEVKPTMPVIKETTVTTSTLLEEIEATAAVVNETKVKIENITEKIEENLKSGED